MKHLSKTHGVQALLALIVLLGASLACQAGTIYGFSKPQGNSQEECLLATIDPTTGKSSAIGTELVTSGLSLDDGPGGYLYGMRGTQLMTYDPQTGEMVDSIALLGSANAGCLAISRCGRFFSQTKVAPMEFELVEIDPATGAVTSVAPGGPTFPLMTGMTFGLDGTLYGATKYFHEFWRIDAETGAGTAIGEIALLYVSGDLSVRSDGTMIMSALEKETDRKVLLTLDPATGATLSEITMVNDVVSMAINGDIGPMNAAPTAEAGADQAVHVGTPAQLDGSGSFDDRTETSLLLYEWSIVATPAGSLAVLSDPYSPSPMLTPDLPGDYVVQLVVTDGCGLTSVPDLVTVGGINLPPTPVAMAEYDLAIIGKPLRLDGSGSTDPEGDECFYSWAITAAPAGCTAVLFGADTVSPSLVPDVEGDYEITLTVSDCFGPGTPASVTFTATTTAGYAEHHLLLALDVVGGLDRRQIRTGGNRRALCNFIGQAIGALHKGHAGTAIHKISKSMERTDGCPVHGAPDRRGPGQDWITDCGAQAVVYELLNRALWALR